MPRLGAARMRLDNLGAAVLLVEVLGEEIGRAVVRQLLRRAVGPVGQLHVGVGGEGALRAARREAVHRHRQFGKAFVQPDILAGVQVPVDHVLEFVRQRPVIVAAAGRAVDIDHLALVAVRVDHGGIHVRRREVAPAPVSGTLSTVMCGSLSMPGDGSAPKVARSVG